MKDATTNKGRTTMTAQHTRATSLHRRLIGTAPFWFAAVMASLLAMCTRKNDISKEPGTDAGADVGPAELVCPKGNAGPSLVLLPATDGSKYCMDARETTRGEYDAFVAAKKGDTSGQPPQCAWNTQFTPVLHDPNSDVPPPSPYYCEEPAWTGMAPDQAVFCLDFCDALAYCEWAGKRLCGRVGGSKWGLVYDGQYSSAKDFSSFATTVGASPESEFINACTQGGKTKYAYGDSLEPGVCIDGTWVDAGHSLAVTDLANRQCHGTIPPFDGVYDLSGSVSEWQNFCWMKQESCILAGSPTACTDDITTPDMRQAFGGIRCCADPVPRTTP